MKTNVEIRSEIRSLVRGRWLWRLLTVTLLLNVMVQTVNLLLSRATSGSVSVVLQLFLMYVFSAIAAYGTAKVMMKAAVNDAERWFVDSLDGFRRPLNVAWLLLVTNVRVFLWLLLLIVPGIVAVYRYRLAWYLKCEKPELDAGTCLARSSQMMDGHKWQAFCLDCWYVAVMTLLAMIMAASGTLTVGAGMTHPILAAVSSVAGVIAVSALIFTVVGLMAARAVFYREIRELCSSNSAESSSC